MEKLKLPKRNEMSKTKAEQSRVLRAKPSAKTEPNKKQKQSRDPKSSSSTAPGAAGPGPIAGHRAP